MKTYRRHILFLVIAGLARTAQSADPPRIDVTVSDHGGKLVMRGHTDANGTFSTGRVAGGDYTVQFDSRTPDVAGRYAVVVSAGRKKVYANAVSAEQFSQRGVAMKLERVEDGAVITGQIAAANPNARLINGKRMVWVSTHETGSNIGGHWEEEGSGAARNVATYTLDAVRNMQERGDFKSGSATTGR